MTRVSFSFFAALMRLNNFLIFVSLAQLALYAFHLFLNPFLLLVKKIRNPYKFLSSQRNRYFCTVLFCHLFAFSFSLSLTVCLVLCSMLISFYALKDSKSFLSGQNVCMNFNVQYLWLKGATRAEVNLFFFCLRHHRASVSWASYYSNKFSICVSA